ncbi:hypothetical protein GJ744_008928 [Endocarpon pusillum]|uniref:Uncharacterized protein n=1 Tax=Endocarpon pusillum TaxID=364733 RepID=A0A8H7AU82_9EURO|nr:hypothetical protein GJ744_008928 [Endocarpon pusillum]
MVSAPYIFFHSGRHWWKDDTDPILVNCKTINEEIARPLLTSLSVNVSRPDTLLSWLGNNDAAYITYILVFVDAYLFDHPPPTRWSELFEKLGREATNLQHLVVYWDYDPPIHTGLGTDLGFVQALTQLKVKRSITLEGFYAKPWPEYLERKMGLRPLEGESSRNGLLRQYQRGTKRLTP